MKTLKALVAVFFATAMLALTGCSKDPEDLIIGTWNATKVIITTTISGTGEFDGTTTDTETFKEGEASMTFKKDGTVVIKTVDEEEGTITENGTYTIKDKTITITQDRQSQSGEIVSIDKKEMEMKLTASYNEQGMSMTMVADMFLKKA